MGRAGLHLGWIAGALFAAMVAIAGHGFEGFAHSQHPVGLLGASLAPRGGLFNALGFVAPGLFIAAFAVAFEIALSPSAATRAVRIGTGLLLIAALAFALQGLIPLDPEDLDGPQTRRHALAHGLSQLAWIAAAVSIAVGLATALHWRIVAACGLLFAGVLLCDLLLPFAGERGWIERGSLLLWFAWPAMLAWRALALRRREP